MLLALIFIAWWMNNMFSIFPFYLPTFLQLNFANFPFLGPPSKPTTPVINATTIQTLTFSFSVDFGSSPIRYFLLNITEYPSGSPNTLNISADDTSGIIQSLTMFERRQTILAYHVEMRLSSQLNNQADYVFAVAAENNISIREFSNASSPARLGEHTYGFQ